MRKPRLTHLQAMRIAQAQREAPIREPLEQELRLCARLLQQTRSALATLERVVGTALGEHIVGKIGRDMAGQVRRQIMEAVVKARRADASGPPAWIDVRLSSDDVLWMDANSIERRVLEEWKEQAAPKLSLRAITDEPIAMAKDITVLDVRVPAFDYRQCIANEL